VGRIAILRLHLRKRPTRSSLAALVLSLVLMGASCGGGAPSGEVNFLVFGDPEELKAFRDVIAGFRRVEPDIEVKLVEASDR
jgi:multiple sugar transport system substrate-binding protein